MTTRPSPSAPASSEASGYERYMLRDPHAVGVQLQRMIDKRCMLTAVALQPEAGQDPAPSVLTAPLAVLDDTIWVDVPRSARMLERLLQCPRLAFDGQLDRVHVRFSSGPAVLDQHEGRPALRLPMPEKMLYLQRRELMRLEPPSGTLHCRIPAGPANEDEATVATIRDIGGGGLAVLVPEAALAMKVGDVLKGCVIELAEAETVEVDLRIRHLRDVSRPAGPVQQAGCEFVALPAATQARLFRYLMQLDRERLTRR